MALPIPIIQAQGTPYEVGQQIGAGARTSLQAMHAQTRADFGERWRALLRAASPYYRATQEHLPRVAEELRGCAQGADLPFDELFLMSVEELLYEEVRGADKEMVNATVAKSKGCSDLAIAPPATRDGHVWLAHNNDLGPDSRQHLFVTRLRAEGEAEILGVTVGGIFISIGMNSVGIALTGNQLTANDTRTGVPRLLIVRDLLARTTLESALDAALLPERASSYNNIISCRDGRMVNVEGSASDAAVTWSVETGGTLVHTNHYLAAEMLRFELEARDTARSAARCSRAFDYARKYRGQFGFELCARFVRDHVFSPWSVCKHSGESVTVFSALIDLTALKMWLAAGNPCENEFALYSLESAIAPAAAPKVRPTARITA